MANQYADKLTQADHVKANLIKPYLGDGVYPVVEVRFPFPVNIHVGKHRHMAAGDSKRIAGVGLG